MMQGTCHRRVAPAGFWVGNRYNDWAMFAVYLNNVYRLK